MASADEELRIDTWLWTARLAETRAVAVTAIKAGHVHIDGERVKPSKGVRVGDRVDVLRGRVRYWRSWCAAWRRAACRRRRRPLFYDETDASIAARERLAAELAGQRPEARVGRRPDQARPSRMDAGH